MKREARPLLSDLRGVLAAAIALAIGFEVNDLLPQAGLCFVTFFPAVILTAHFCGTRPGVICAVLSGLAAWYFFMPPTWSFALSWPVLTALVLYAFVVGAALMSTHALRRAAAGLRASRHEMAERCAALERQFGDRTNELRAAAALQTAILNDAGYAVIATDLAGTITLFNPAAERMLGYAADELVGRTTPALFHDADEVAARATALSAELGHAVAPGFEVFVSRTKRGLPNVGEWTYVTKSGRRVPVLLNVSALRTEGGAELGFLGIASDLTARYTHEAELKAAKTGTWTYRIADGRVSMSAETARQHGLAEVAVDMDAGTEWRPLVHPGDADRAVAALKCAIATCGRLETEFQVPLATGAVRWITAIGQVETDLAGVPVRLVGLTLDLTSQKQAELALQDSERRYRLVAENAADLIMVCPTFSGAPSYVSPSVRQSTGFGPDDVASLEDLVHPEDREALHGGFSALSLAAPRATPVFRMRRKAGDPLWLEAALALTLGGPVVVTARDITARRATERALLESELRFRSLAETSTDMIQVLRLDGRQRYVSPASRELFGIDPRTMLGTHPAEVIHPAETERVCALLADLGAGRKERGRSLHRVRHATGQFLWVEAQFRLVRDQQTGQPREIVSNVRDMTQHQALRADIEEANRHLRMAEEIAHVGHWRLEFPSNRIAWSDEVFRIHGLDPRGPVPALDAAIDAYHPDDRQQVDRHVTAALEGGTDFRFGLRLVRPSGEIRHILSRGLCEKDEGGAVTALFGTIVDVTELRAAEQAAVTSEARYRLLAETATDVTVQLDLDLNCTYASRASRDALGYEPHDLLGQRSWSFVHPEDLEQVRRLCRDLVGGRSQGDRSVCTYRFLRHDGGWIWIEASINLLRDEHDKAPLLLVCALRDVTIRQRAAQQLERAKATAESAVQVKAEFVANMSHELRTPLTGIMAIHDLLLRDQSLGEEQRRLIDLASGAGRSLLTIVNDVLDFLKIEAGQMAIEAIPFDLIELLAGCQGLAIEAAKGKPLTVEVLRARTVPRHLIGDPTRLRQILLNLMGNAVKFTASGTVTVRVSYGNARGMLRVDVTDTGMGIPADQVQVLFDRFTQADTSTVRRFGGTGLGLAICKRLTALMGGDIGVLPATEGAHLWFELPLRSVAETASPDVVEAAAAATTAAVGCHLLLAEDNDLNANLIALMLRRQGFEVTCVPDGAAAVSAVQTRPDLDLVLMDLQMPVMDGLAATAAIRALPALAGGDRIPIIGLTANALASDADRCRAAGMDAHVPKPIVWSKLFDTIETLLSRRRDLAAAAGVHQAGSDAKVLDRDTLVELAQLIGTQKLVPMLERFLEQLQASIADLGRMDDGALAEHFHRCASMAGHFGLGRLSALSAQAEVELRSGRPCPNRDLIIEASREAVAALQRETETARQSIGAPNGP